MEIIPSALWVGGTLVVAEVVADKINLPFYWSGSMPKSAPEWAVPVSGAALGYYWYGPIGAVGGVIGAYASTWVFLMLLGSMGAF